MRYPKITQKDILFLAISMFAIVLAWISFNLYHTYVTTTISEDLQMQIMPIDPRFDTDTINALKSRTLVEPLFQESQITPASSPATLSPSPAIIQTTPEQEITPTAEDITPTEELVPSETQTPLQSGPTVSP